MDTKKHKVTDSFYCWYATYFALDLLSKALDVKKSRIIEKACGIYLDGKRMREADNIIIEDESAPGTASIVSYTISSEYKALIEKEALRRGETKSRVMNIILMMFLRNLNSVLPLIKKGELGHDKTGNYLFSVEKAKIDPSRLTSGEEFSKYIKKEFYNEKNETAIFYLAAKSRFDLAVALAYPVDP